MAASRRRNAGLPPRKAPEKPSPRAQVQAQAFVETFFPSAEPGSSVSDAVRRELDAAAVTDSALGAVALVLAGRLDACSAEPAGQLASVARELRALLSEALADRVTESDPLDELTRRRDAKRSG